MDTVYLVHKLLGETPLEALTRFRRAHNIPDITSLTYAGRLDPMATGLLLILADKAITKKESYLGLPKTYETTFIFGASTDTGDTLGVINKTSFVDSIDPLAIPDIILGKHTLEIPAFSSVPYKGKPLFTRAHDGTLPPNLPTREMEVTQAALIQHGFITAQELAQVALKRISFVTGNFRQEAIRYSWQNYHPQNQKLPWVKLTLTVTSGTYIRALTTLLTQTFGVPVMLYELKRTAIGNFLLPKHTIQEAPKL